MMDRVREISNYLRDNKIVTTKQGQLAIERKLQEDIKIYGADEIMAAAKVAIDKDIHSYAYLLTIIKNSKKKSDSNEKTYPTEKQKQYITNLEDSISFIINKVTHSQIVSDIKLF